MSAKNKSEKKSEVSAIVARFLALAETFKTITVSPLVERVILALCGLIESYGETKAVQPFTGPAMPSDPSDAQAMADWAQAYVAAKAEYDKNTGDERKGVKSALEEGFKAIVEDCALSGKEIEPERRARAEAMLRATAGKKPGDEGYKPLSVIANETQISAPTLNNWKKALGLVKSRE